MTIYWTIKKVPYKALCLSSSVNITVEFSVLMLHFIPLLVCHEHGHADIRLKQSGAKWANGRTLLYRRSKEDRGLKNENSNL